MSAEASLGVLPRGHSEGVDVARRGLEDVME